VPILGYFVIAIGAYLLGSIPTGYLVGRARGIDIRTAGSGNIGATNVFRSVGKPMGGFVLLMDALKGYAAAKWLCVWLIKLFNVPGAEMETCQIVAGICAVLGHNYTCWLKFKGGKGVSTSAGVFLALAPLATGIAVGAWIIVLVLCRYASVASIVAAVALPATVWLTPNSLTLRIVTTALGLLIIFKHRSNIQRLVRGTESRVRFKSKGTAT
jgi:glycerol-3-phosphate acyltransferase PlsY